MKKGRNEPTSQRLCFDNKSLAPVNFVVNVHSFTITI